MFMNIKSIAAQEAEKRYNTDIPEISIGLNAIKQIVFKDACEWLLEYLADSDGDIHKFLQDKGVMSLAETFSPVTIQEWLKEYTAIHTAKMLGDRWIPVSERLPENNEDVLISDGWHIWIGYYKNTGVVWPASKWVSYGENEPYGISYYAITHWQPLPQSPNK